VRYMWVKGNLKDTLGIRHRSNGMVIVNGASSDPEVVPIFRDAHMSSTSETSAADVYEHGVPRGPGDRTPPTRVEELNATASATSVTSSSSPHHTLPPTIVGGDEDTMATPISPAWEMQTAAVSPSPQPSNYSASDVPIQANVLSPSSYEPSKSYPGVASISYSRPFRGQCLSPSENHRLPPSTYEMQAPSPKLEQRSSPSELRELSEIDETVIDEGDRSNYRHSRSSSLAAWRTSTLSTANDSPVAL